MEVLKMHYLCTTNHPFYVMKRNLLSLLLLLVVGIAAHGQPPQFSSRSFEDWVYSNTAVELNPTNILANKVCLYINSQRVPLTLTSPLFTCAGGSILDIDVTWVTDQWQNENFVERKVALTATILDANGNAMDSVTYTPHDLSRTNYVNLPIAVPEGLSRMKVRFASWKADVNSNGAVREIEMTTLQRGDVNRDGTITISDINAVIGIILSGSQDGIPIVLADLNGDGSVTIADINCIIGLILH